MGFMDGLKKGIKEGAAKELVKQITKKIEAGDKDAMVKLGSMYFQGEDVTVDLNEAFRLFKMAADLGHPAGLNNVGVCFENGSGVAKNLDTAMAYYQKAGAAGFSAGLKNVERLKSVIDEDPLRSLLPKAEAGDGKAQTELGYRYAKGIDVEQDDQQAIKWLTPAASASHFEAQFYLGRLYVDDMNLPSEGIPWLEKSASGGYAHAQSKLGIMYASGKSVVKDLEKAAELMRQAAIQGNKDAANNLAIVEKQIAAQQKQAATPPPQPAPKASVVTTAPAAKTCTQCGAGLQDGTKFCGGCGAKVEQVQFCTGCGVKMVTDSKFCGECGTAVSGASTSPVQPGAAMPLPIKMQVNKKNEDDNDLTGENPLEKFSGIDPDLVTVFNLKIGYTQGELNATEKPDYDDGFKAGSHSYWKFTIVMDNGGDTGYDWLLLDWSNKGASTCISGDEEAAETIAELVSATTEEMFGSPISAICFQSVIQAVLDEPEGYDFIEEALENVGGYIEVEEGDKISDSFVNSLFVLYEEIDPSTVTFEDGNLLLNGELFDIESINDSCISEKKYAAFSEDVMGY